jgi:hypothetical protein
MFHHEFVWVIWNTFIDLFFTVMYLRGYWYAMKWYLRGSFHGQLLEAGENGLI